MELFGSIATARCKARTARSNSPFFSSTFPIRMYGTGRSRVQPNGALQQAFRVIELLNPRISVS